MKILVIGGNGFIGSHLIDELVNRNHDIRVFDIAHERFRAPNKNIDYRIASLESIPDIYEALLEIELVYYLASSSVPSTSNIDTVTDVNRNIIPLLNLLNLLTKLNIKRFVYFSSGGAIYGNSCEKKPLNEEHPNDPVSSYGITKLTIEKYLKLYKRLYNIDSLIIRPSNPFGPRQGHYNAQGIISTFLSKIKKNEPLTIFGDGNIIKDYIYIDDLIKDCVELSEKKATGVFNIGSGVGTSINNIITSIHEITGSNPIIKNIEQKKYDVEHFVLDISKLESTIMRHERTSFKKGIALTWNWINNHN